MPSRTHATLAVTAPRDTPFRTVRPLRALLLCLPSALVGCGAAPVVGGSADDVAGEAGGTATPVAGNVVAVRYDCDGIAVEAREGEAAVELAIGDRVETLPRVAAASGAKYETGVDETYRLFWVKGDEARLALGDAEWLACGVAIADATASEGTGAGSGARTDAGTDAQVGRAALGTTLDARGQEPPWSLQLLAGSLVLERGHEGGGLVATLRESRPIAGGGTRHVATGDGVEVRVDVAPTVCRDTMGDLPYPTSVEVSVTEQGESEALRGCGGDPVELLGVGREWTVERVEGDEQADGGAVAGPAPTIAFGADGRASGSTGCNRWSGAWTLTGEALNLGRISSTRRACRGATGAREARFLRVLEGVRTFDVRGDGALVLATPAGETIVARASDG